MVRLQLPKDSDLFESHARARAAPSSRHSRAEKLRDRIDHLVSARVPDRDSELEPRAEIQNAPALHRHLPSDLLHCLLSGPFASYLPRGQRMIGEGGLFVGCSLFLIASRAGSAVSGTRRRISCGRGSRGSTRTGVTTTRSSLSLFAHLVLEKSWPRMGMSMRYGIPVFVFSISLLNKPEMIML